jgi:hypothetical protein
LEAATQQDYASFVPIYVRLVVMNVPNIIQHTARNVQMYVSRVLQLAEI